MGYWDGLVSSYFKKNDSGRIIFYPYGKLGSGYFLTQEDADRMAAFLRTFLIVFFIANFILYFFNRILALLSLFVFVGFYKTRMDHLLKSAEQTQEKMGWMESLNNMADRLGTGWELSLFLISAAMIGLSVVVFRFTVKPWIGILGFIFFGSGLILSVLLLALTIRSRK